MAQAVVSLISGQSGLQAALGGAQRGLSLLAEGCLAGELIRAHSRESDARRAVTPGGGVAGGGVGLPRVGHPEIGPVLVRGVIPVALIGESAIGGLAEGARADDG